MTQAHDALELERDLALSRRAPRPRPRTELDRGRIIRAVVGSSYFHAHDRRRALELVHQVDAPPARRLRLLPAIATLVATAAIAASLAPPADAHPPTGTEVGLIPADVDVVDVAVPAEWNATGERLATDYAAAVGYPDVCAGRKITVAVADNLPKVIGPNVLGVAWAGGSAPYACAMAIGASELVDRCAYLRVYAHERLHLARNDGWHSPATEPSNPLGPYWTPPGCQYLPGLGSPRTSSTSTSTRSTFLRPLSRSLSKVAVRRRFQNRQRWTFTVCDTDAVNGRLERVTVCAQRKMRAGAFDLSERRYEVTRDVATLRVRRLR